MVHKVVVGSIDVDAPVPIALVYPCEYEGVVEVSELGPWRVSERGDRGDGGRGGDGGGGGGGGGERYG